jgi:hypothetical protein
MPTFAKLNLKDQIRMVAIDEDWSALRFRRVEFIKTINRPEEMRLTKKKR